MVSKPSNRRGRPARFVRDSTSKEIYGLSQSKTDGRYYLTFSKPRRWLGKDFPSALVAFREWQAQQKDERITIVDERPVLLRTFKDTIPTGQTAQVPIAIRDDVFWAEVRRRILDDPYLAAEKTGLPLDRLEQFKSPAESMTIKEIGDFYFDNKTINKTWKKMMADYWNDFLAHVKVKKVSDITPRMIINYGIYVEKQGKGFTPVFVRQRFQAIRTIFRYAQKKHVDIEYVSKVLAYLAGLDMPKKNGVNPKEIAKQDFHQLLEAANTQWKAILLLSLNCAFLPIDICQVRIDAINFQAKTLRNFRTKTGIPRIAVLWDRTIAAIKNYLKTRPYDMDTLFISNNGPYVPNSISKGFSRLRERVGLPITVEFNHIRDSSQTAAIQGNADPVHVDMLLGHKTGIRDNYLLRKPSMVADTCSAIEKYYF